MNVEKKTTRKRLTPSRKRSLKWKLLSVALSSATFVVLISLLGWLQLPEWMMLDAFFRLRPIEPVDSRILVVTISDADISAIGAYPIPDQTLAIVLRNLSARSPRVIGLDLYRDLPVEPGYASLVKVFRSTPNLIGVQKRFGTRRVPPPPVLAQLGQVAIVDLVEDSDGKVRRSLLSSEESGQVYLSLGAQAALNYLRHNKIELEAVKDSPEQYRLGRATFKAFQENDGGYVRADDNGYQMLLNYRGRHDRFETLTLSEVLANQIPDELVRDRVVLIGSIAESSNDSFLTPFSDSNGAIATRMSGVFIHANVTSQILSAAIDQRPLLQTLPDFAEWIWIGIWSGIGVLMSWRGLKSTWFDKLSFYNRAVLGVLTLGLGLVSVSYFLFLASWWLPTIAPVLAMTASSIACLTVYGQKLQQMAFYDDLTQVANRRFFNQYLIRRIQKGHLTLILCDVDYFKNYNDAYGHPAGDICLRQIALTLHRAVRETDLVARYGGEEFAIVLPNTNVETAKIVAQRILDRVRDLQLPHQKSLVSDQVTISCGVAGLSKCQISDRAELAMADLIARADQALYKSKQEGRDRVTIAP